MENINQEHFSSPNDLITAVLGTQPLAKGAEPVPPQSQPDEPRFGEVPVSAFNSALPLATGSLVSSVDEIKQLYERAQQAEALATRVSEMEAQQATAFKPATPFVAKLNDLLASGADAGKISAFWSLANADVESMAPLDVIAFATRMEHPDLSEKR